MLRYLLYFVGFQLQILVHTSQSSERTTEKADIKKLARKLISETLTDQLTEYVIDSEKPPNNLQLHYKYYKGYEKSNEDRNKNVMHHKKETPYHPTKNLLKEATTLLEESLQETRFIESLESSPKNFKDSNEMTDEGISVQVDTTLNNKHIMAKNNQHTLQQKDTKYNDKQIAVEKLHHLFQHLDERHKLNDQSSDEKKHHLSKNQKEYTKLNHKKTPEDKLAHQLKYQRERTKLKVKSMADDRQSLYKNKQEHTKLNDKQMHEKKRQHLYKHQQKRTKLTDKRTTDTKLHHLYKHNELRTKLNHKQSAGNRYHHLHKHQQEHIKLKNKQMTDNHQPKYQQKNTKMNYKPIPDDMQKYHPNNQRHDYKKPDNFLGFRNKPKVIHTHLLKTRNSEAHTTILPKVKSPSGKSHEETPVSARKTRTYPIFEGIRHGRIVSSSISQEFMDDESKSDDTIAKSLNTFKTHLDEIISKKGVTSKSDKSTSTAKTTKPGDGT